MPSQQAMLFDTGDAECPLTAAAAVALFWNREQMQRFGKGQQMPVIQSFYNHTFGREQHPKRDCIACATATNTLQSQVRICIASFSLFALHHGFTTAGYPTRPYKYSLRYRKVAVVACKSVTET